MFRPLLLLFILPFIFAACGVKRDPVPYVEAYPDKPSTPEKR